MSLKVLLADDHEMFRKGLRLLLEEEADLEVVGEAGDGASAIEMARELAPDLVVMDVSMPDVDGIQATRKISDSVPDTRVVGLSIHTGRRFVGDMLRAGAKGYVLKKSAPEDLVDALRTVGRGEVYLSPAIAGVVVSEFVSSPDPSEPEEHEDQTRLVLRTKLHSPEEAPDAVRRSRLADRWEELRTRPLTVVSASAGYGKSTLAAQWLRVWDGPHAWLSLGEEDNDPRVFTAGLVASIRGPFPGSCRETEALLLAGQLPPSTDLGRQLLNDIDAIPDPFVLVLDDYHRIHASEVHDLVAEMLRHPPRRVHTILLTRRDPPLPVSRLRGRGLVNELDVTELRFSVEETGEFLGRVFGRPFAEQAARAIQEKLEGWPAGMRLVAQSFRKDVDIDRLVASLEGGFASVVDYLVDEVLSRLPKPVADCIVRASILDRFCAPLCDALQEPEGPDGGDPIAGHDLLDQLRRDNLFLVPLDNEGRWFRFHHLFQELLRMQLERRSSTDEIAALQERAGAWLGAAGHVEEAIRHLLAAGDVDGATRLVADHRQAQLEEDRWYVLEKWLSAFPEEAVRERPVLLLSLIWVLDYRFDHAELIVALEKADALVGEDDPLRAEVDFFYGYLSYFANDPAGSLEHLRAAQERIPAEHHEFRVQTEMLVGLARQMVGEEVPALERLGELLFRGRALRGGTRTRLQATVALIHLQEARLSDAEAANRDLYRHATRGGYRHAEAWSNYIQGLIHFWRNESEEAITGFDRVVSARFVVESRVVLDCLSGAALSQEGVGRADLADEAVRSLVEAAESSRDPGDSLIALSGRTRLSLQRGGAKEVDGLLRRQCPSDENMLCWLEIPAVTWCRALIADGSEGSLKDARELLGELLHLNRANHNKLQLIDILTLSALAHGSEETEQAAAFAREAAGLAALGGAWRPLVEAGPPMIDLLRLALDADSEATSVRRALSALGAEDVADSPSETGPLTPREAEVLRLVAEGLSNKEIATRIFRSMETVKKHLYNTYQKLEVDSRIAALSKARELGILPPEGQ